MKLSVEIYQKKHFIISPEYCNTAKHLNNDLSLLTSDYVSDKFSGNMGNALDILLLLLISCIIAKLEMIKCSQTLGHWSPHHLKEAESMDQERRLLLQSSGISRVMSPGSGAAQDRSTNILNNYTTWTRKKRKLFSQSWTPHLSYFNFFFGCLFHLNKRYNFHFPHFKNVSFHRKQNIK